MTVMDACIAVERRDGPWWGPGQIAATLGIAEPEALAELDRLRKAGSVDADVCGAGPDGEPVLAWWVVGGVE
jgi:hypothetical protein